MNTNTRATRPSTLATLWNGIKWNPVFQALLMFSAIMTLVVWLLEGSDLELGLRQHDPLSVEQIAEASDCVRLELREKSESTREVLTKGDLRAAKRLCEDAPILATQRDALSIKD